ncbi:MAG: transcriptional repressor LexA [Myxococcota bacterium]|nr:transcriptional repressor LexA [Myxococcota bacterium]
MKELTQRQQQILDFIIAQTEAKGYPPTIREIGEHMQIKSTNGVSDHLRALMNKGYLVRDESKSRALRPAASLMIPKPVAPTLPVRHVPVLGSIAAGQPITAFEDGDERLAIDVNLFRRANEEVFALRVKGDSMIDDAILNGDLVFVRKQETAGKGEIVAAIIEGEATVKRYMPRKDEIVFLPANPDFEPIVVKGAERREVQILGVVVGVVRQLVV